MDLPYPTGPYTVGSIDIYPNIGTSTAHATLMKLFYPSIDSPGSCDYPKWSPNPQYTLAYLNFMNFQPPNGRCLSDIADEIDKVSIPARLDAPLLIDHSPYPVIVLSHGRGGMRCRYSALCCELSSHGYIVAAPEHCDGTACLAFKRPSDEHHHRQDEWMPYMVKDDNQSEFDFRNKQVLKRSNELQFALDVLSLLNNGHRISNLTKCDMDIDQFKNCLAIDKVGIIGHSFGGASIITALANDIRFKCGIALDPCMMPISTDIIEGGRISQPLLIINTANYQTIDSIQCILKLMGSPSADKWCHMLTLKGTVHRSQTDTVFVLKGYLIGNNRPHLDPLIGHQVNSQICLNFFKGFVLKDSLTLSIDELIQTPHTDIIIDGTNINH
jgi:platelet-activating factor acetylhydrolase